MKSAKGEWRINTSVTGYVCPAYLRKDYGIEPCKYAATHKVIYFDDGQTKLITYMCPDHAEHFRLPPPYATNYDVFKLPLGIQVANDLKKYKYKVQWSNMGDF